MKLLYKPFSILAAVIASRIGRSLFNNVWKRIDEVPPPHPDTGEASLVKVVGAQALQAGLMAGVAALIKRLSATSFHHLFGAWPENREKKKG